MLELYNMGIEAVAKDDCLQHIDLPSWHELIGRQTKGKSSDSVWAAPLVNR